MLLSTADSGIDDILVLLSAADSGIDDTPVLLSTADCVLMTHQCCYLLLIVALMTFYK